jgi:predicted enzyme related to lactoylglutathione lyase
MLNKVRKAKTTVGKGYISNCVDSEGNNFDIWSMHDLGSSQVPDSGST